MDFKASVATDAQREARHGQADKGHSDGGQAQLHKDDITRMSVASKHLREVSSGVRWPRSSQLGESGRDEVSNQVVVDLPINGDLNGV